MKSTILTTLTALMLGTTLAHADELDDIAHCEMMGKVAVEIMKVRQMGLPYEDAMRLAGSSRVGVVMVERAFTIRANASNLRRAMAVAEFRYDAETACLQGLS